MRHTGQIRHISRGKGLSGYMTVEASFIIPLAFVCFILTILCTFHLYNHMAVYQGCYLAALRGSMVKNTTASAIEEYVREEAVLLLDEQVYQYSSSPEVDVGALSIEVRAESGMDNLMERFGLYKEKRFTSTRRATAGRTDPVDYIRNMHRF